MREVVAEILVNVMLCVLFAFGVLVLASPRLCQRVWVRMQRGLRRLGEWW